MLGTLLDLFFPKSSLGGEEGQFLTTDEREALRRSNPLMLTRPQLKLQGIRHIDQLIAGARYADPVVQRAIRALKYGRIVDLHAELSTLIIRALPGRYFFPIESSPPLLCPVPLHWTRRLNRGFNQSTVIAEDLQRALRWPVVHLLKRTRPTGHQAHRKRAQRLMALRGVFAYAGPEEAPAHVILIDDLCTTGSTLDECAQVLRDAGVKRIDAFVVAHG